jgi:hypothetical protein
MNKIRNLKDDPVEQLARRLAESVYVTFGCASVPLLQRVIADALRRESENDHERQ